MTPNFARAVDPLFLHVLGLLDRIGREEEPNPQEERLLITTALDQAEATVGISEEWGLAKYAMVSWVDEVLSEAPWQGREWWQNNVLEVELFNSRLCNELFYTKAQQASSLATRDALEVFYICVVLGFRGFYRDPQLSAMIAPARSLPPDMDSWARQVALAIRLGQGLPELKETQEEGAGAPPLEGPSLVIWCSLSLLMLTSLLAVVFLAS